MANPYIPRARVHELVEEVAESPGSHKAVLTYLVRSQRRLAKYVEANARNTGVGRKGTALFIMGLIARMFDLEGGKMANLSVKTIGEAEQRVAGWAKDVLPVDDGFAERVRQVAERAQPHILDECLMSLFDDEELDAAGMAKMFFLMWVVVESYDASWSPPQGFDGESTYTYVDVEGASMNQVDVELG